MLLLITGSGDGTADRIVLKLGEEVFRFNYDLFSDYKFQLTPDYWEIEDPVGRKISSLTCTRVFWWKAFSYWIEGQDKLIKAEVKYIFRDLFGLVTAQKIAKGNSPSWHDKVGKMHVLTLAKKYFEIPTTLVTSGLSGIDIFNSKKVVAKSLASQLSNQNTVLFTTDVETNRLHPDFPWYLQEKIQSRWDVTVFYCDGNVFPFKRDRINLKGIDWRAEQSLDVQVEEWLPFKLTQEQSKAFDLLSNDLDVEFGRYDLMTNGDSEELIFLEFNANGQWVFLDYQEKYGLLDAVVNWLRK